VRQLRFGLALSPAQLQRRLRLDHVGSVGWLHQRRRVRARRRAGKRFTGLRQLQSGHANPLAHLQQYVRLERVEQLGHVQRRRWLRRQHDGIGKRELRHVPRQSQPQPHLQRHVRLGSLGSLGQLHGRRGVCAHGPCPSSGLRPLWQPKPFLQCDELRLERLGRVRQPGRVLTHCDRQQVGVVPSLGRPWQLVPIFRGYSRQSQLRQ
jgi:hypothetical protein